MKPGARVIALTLRDSGDLDALPWSHQYRGGTKAISIVIAVSYNPAQRFSSKACLDSD